MNIAIVTGSRAERGLMEGLCTKLLQENDIEVFDIEMKLDIAFVGYNDDPGDRQAGRMQSTIYAMREHIGYTRKPYDYAILPGDRYEMIAAGIALHMLKIPCVHIFGGYVTEGSQDDAWRHCLTKLSQLHFVENEECRQRVIQLGEHPDTVHNVGMIGCDFSDIEADSTYDYIVIYHPETLGETDVEPLKHIFWDRSKVLWIKPNSDPDREKANIDGAVHNYFAVRDDIPRKQFLSYLKGAKAIIGNSSAGIREAPMLGTPAVNIGDRQQGRTGIGVYHARNNITSISVALKWALKYGGGYVNHDGTDEIVRILNEWKPRIRKRFYDI